MPAKDFRLPINFTYASVCLFLPGCNGLLNGFLWGAYTLHFEANGWPVARAGLAQGLGFAFRVATQQMQLAAGYWLIVPLSIIHLAFAVLGGVYPNSEWAVFAEILVVFTIDPTCAIEGLAFDSFRDSEVQARQAASTSLSVYTICVASSCTIAAAIFDSFGWPGIAAYHTICQALLVFMLLIQPLMKKSFMEVWFPAKEDDMLEDQEMKPDIEQSQSSEQSQERAERAPSTVEASPASGAFLSVLPGTFPEHDLGGAGDLVVENIEEDDVHSDLPDNPRPRKTVEIDELDEPISRPSNISKIRPSNNSKIRPSNNSNSSKVRASHNTNVSGFSAMSAKSAVSVLTALSEAGEDFRYHFSTNLSVQPQIVGPTGAKPVFRDAFEFVDKNEHGEEKVETSASIPSRTTTRAKIPKEIRLPAFLIVMNCFCNTAAYVIEFSTFAMFFKQVHNWDAAVWASIAQTAGDLIAAILMKVIPALMPGDYDENEAGCCRRFWHTLTSKPYTISCVLATWILFNAGMISPLLPVVIASQVFMGTSYVYSCKWSTDMSIFYSLGDSKVFLALQVFCQNANALGGGLGSILGSYLFTLDPAAPFIFGTGMTTCVFLVYTVGFCARVGFGDEIEDAEAKFSRRKGERRVSSWGSDGRKSNMSITSQMEERKSKISQMEDEQGVRRVSSWVPAERRRQTSQMSDDEQGVRRVSSWGSAELKSRMSQMEDKQ